MHRTGQKHGVGITWYSIELAALHSDLELDQSTSRMICLTHAVSRRARWDGFSNFSPRKKMAELFSIWRHVEKTVD